MNKIYIIHDPVTRSDKKYLYIYSIVVRNIVDYIHRATKTKEFVKNWKP